MVLADLAFLLCYERTCNWHIIVEICTMKNTNTPKNITVKQMKFLISLMLAFSIVIVQTGGVFAASPSHTASSLTGAVQSITLDTDSVTGVTIVLVTIMDSNQAFQTVRVSEKTAKDLGLVIFDSDGKPLINESALGTSIEVRSEMILPDPGEEQLSVGNTIAALFQRLLDWIRSTS
jgi:hypothetical protein